MITLVRNKLDVDTYLSLRASVKWKKLSRSQAQKALENSLFVVCAYDGKRPAGMGRIVGDGAVICYIQDLLVHPDYQGMGIGNRLLQELRNYVLSIREEGTEMMLDLMCAKDREMFYTKHGFIARPTKNLGPGMIQYLNDRHV
ncbi:MAG TPA: GNAT family N-acetyltransferase [Candidatus Fimousia stercorigallinarum]|nr:GNAT family N-acetyltransferase [Candidatus Fimousia stercorigallinarum]